MSTWLQQDLSGDSNSCRRKQESARLTRTPRKGRFHLFVAKLAGPEHLLDVVARRTVVLLNFAVRLDTDRNFVVAATENSRGLVCTNNFSSVYEVGIVFSLVAGTTEQAEKAHDQQASANYSRGHNFLVSGTLPTL